jgi:hypothetical protein
VLANRDEVRRALKRAQAGLASTDAGDPPAATAG